MEMCPVYRMDDICVGNYYFYEAFVILVSQHLFTNWDMSDEVNLVINIEDISSHGIAMLE